jgi:hypothetical protein
MLSIVHTKHNKLILSGACFSHAVWDELLLWVWMGFAIICCFSFVAWGPVLAGKCWINWKLKLWVMSGEGRILDIIGQDASVSKSNPVTCRDLPVVPLFIVGCTLQTPLKCSVEFLKSWTSSGYFSNSIGSSATSGRVGSPRSLVIEEGVLRSGGVDFWRRNEFPGQPAYE